MNSTVLECLTIDKTCSIMNHMKILIAALVFTSCTFTVKDVEANDYNTAVLGHILTEKIKGTDMDESSIANAETQRLIHNMSLDIIEVVFKSMPSILDGISADMRSKADKNYKCALQSDEYRNKDCN